VAPVICERDLLEAPANDGQNIRSSHVRVWPPLRTGTLWRYVAVALLTCVGLSLIDGMQYSIFPSNWAIENNPTNFWVITGAGFGYWLVIALLFPFVRALAIRFPLDQTRRWRDVTAHCAAAFVFAILFLGGGTWIQIRLGLSDAPYLPFVERLFRSFFSLSFLTYWGTLAVALLITSLERAKENELRTSHLEANLAQVQLRALRSRLNPHFLFNSLNCVSGLASTQDSDKVIEVVGRLSQLLRRCLDDEGALEVPLRLELSFLDDYLEIERVRFPDRLNVRFAIDPQALAGLVPSMLLQPLVENAVQHGISRTEGPAYIDVTAERQGSSLNIGIRDTGPGFAPASTPSSTGFGLGLKATKDRLRLLFGDKGSIDCVNCQDSGAMVNISIPFHTAG
jgi:two-component system, LytTR family, sensor kinase